MSNDNVKAEVVSTGAVAANGHAPDRSRPITFETVVAGLRYPHSPIWIANRSLLVLEVERASLTYVGDDGHVEIVANLGGGPVGAAIGPDGKVFVCNNGGHVWSEVDGAPLPGNQPSNYAGGKIQVVDIATGSVESLYEEVDGILLRGPKALVFDDDDGFWFVDSGKVRPRQRDRGGLYYAKADGSEIREVVFPLDNPSGVALSPDGDTLYVCESQQGRIYAWPLSGPGKIAGYFGQDHRGSLVADPEGGPILDGVVVDAFGNICVACSGSSGVLSVTTDGAYRSIPIDDPIVTSLCFGGPNYDRMYVTLGGSGRLIAADWDVTGLGPRYGAPELLAHLAGRP